VSESQTQSTGASKQEAQLAPRSADRWMKRRESRSGSIVVLSIEVLVERVENPPSRSLPVPDPRHGKRFRNQRRRQRTESPSKSEEASHDPFYVRRDARRIG